MRRGRCSAMRTHHATSVCAGLALGGPSGARRVRTALAQERRKHPGTCCDGVPQGKDDLKRRPLRAWRACATPQESPRRHGVPTEWETLPDIDMLELHEALDSGN